MESVPKREEWIKLEGEREGVLKNLVHTGYQTTEPNQIGTQRRQIRLMTNSRKPQSEKLATGGGRGQRGINEQRRVVANRSNRFIKLGNESALRGRIRAGRACRAAAGMTALRTHVAAPICILLFLASTQGARVAVLAVAAAANSEMGLPAAAHAWTHRALSQIPSVKAGHSCASHLSHCICGRGHSLRLRGGGGVPQEVGWGASHWSATRGSKRGNMGVTTAHAAQSGDPGLPYSMLRLSGGMEEPYPWNGDTTYSACQEAAMYSPPHASADPQAAHCARN